MNKLDAIIEERPAANAAIDLNTLSVGTDEVIRAFIDAAHNATTWYDADASEGTLGAGSDLTLITTDLLLRRFRYTGAGARLIIDRTAASTGSLRDFFQNRNSEIIILTDDGLGRLPINDRLYEGSNDDEITDSTMTWDGVASITSVIDGIGTGDDVLIVIAAKGTVFDRRARAIDTSRYISGSQLSAVGQRAHNTIITAQTFQADGGTDDYGVDIEVAVVPEGGSPTFQQLKALTQDDQVHTFQVSHGCLYRFKHTSGAKVRGLISG